MTTEDTPLLSTQNRQPAGRKHGKLDWWTFSTICLVFLINFLFFTGQMLALAPRMQIYESIICRDYSSRDVSKAPLDAGRCKDTDVQSELAFVLGIEELLTVFLSLFSIPYSFVADRYGWCPVLSLSMFGVVLEMIWPLFVCTFSGRLPLHWVWLGIAFEAIGGGPTVTVTMFNLILVKLVSQESRTHIFLYFTASSLVATATGQLTSTLIMHSDIWLPAWIGCGVNILALGLSFVLPQTIAKHVTSGPLGGNSQEEETNTSHRSIKESCIQVLRKLRSIGLILRNNPQIAIVLFSAFAFPLGEDSMFTVILLYISKRYDWSIADANFLVGFSSLAQLFTFLVGLPLLGYILIAYGGVTIYFRDRILVQVESVILFIGALCLAFAPTVILAICGIVLMSFGMAVITVLRSLVTNLVHPQEITLVYSMMTMMMRIGSGVAGPVFAWGFGLGIKLGQAWTGLPFIIAAGFFLTGTVTLAFISKDPLTKDDENIDADNTSEQEA